MRQVRSDQAIERGNEPMRGVWGNVEPELLDGDEPAGVRLVRAEDRTKGAGANLVQDPKRPECVRWRGAGSVRMQRRYSSGNREDGTTETSAVQSFSRVTVGAR